MGWESSHFSTEDPQISHIALTGQLARWAGGAGEETVAVSAPAHEIRWMPDS